MIKGGRRQLEKTIKAGGQNKSRNKLYVTTADIQCQSAWNSRLHGTGRLRHGGTGNAG